MGQHDREKGQGRTVPPSRWPPLEDALIKASWALSGTSHDMFLFCGKSALFVTYGHDWRCSEAHCLRQPPGATLCPCLGSEANQHVCVGPHSFCAKVRTWKSGPLTHCLPQINHDSNHMTQERPVQSMFLYHSLNIQR